MIWYNDIIARPDIQSSEQYEWTLEEDAWKGKADGKIPDAEHYLTHEEWIP